MKKKFIRYLIPSLTLAAGIAIAAAGFSMGAQSDYINRLNITSIDSAFPPEGVVSLNVDVVYADLEITASNDVSDFEISAENVSRDFLKYSVSNNILNLRYTTNKWYETSALPILSKKSGKIKITVPAHIQLRDIQIKSGIGETAVNYLSAENIYIDCGLGNSNLSSVTAEYIEINGSAGDVYTENLTSESLLLSGKSGKSEMVNFHTETAEISAGTGDLSLSGVISADSIIRGGMGDIRADIFGNLNDYSICVSKGKAEINGKSFSGTTKGKHKMNISAGIGDVVIKFK